MDVNYGRARPDKAIGGVGLCFSWIEDRAEKPENDSRFVLAEILWAARYS